MKKGETRWTATIDDETGKIEYDEWILKSIRRRNIHNRYVNPFYVKNFHWVQKIKGITWVKLSTKHFDWGWAKNIPAWLKYSHYEGLKCRLSASRQGALQELAKTEKFWFKRNGDKYLEPGELTHAEKLKKIAYARKRLK